MATLLKLKWDVLPHPPYSPDLAPSDYHLFGPMKRVLRGKRFRNNDEVICSCAKLDTQATENLLLNWNEEASRTLAQMYGSQQGLH
jgi:hypothetical protein